MKKIIIFVICVILLTGCKSVQPQKGTPTIIPTSRNESLMVIDKNDPLLDLTPEEFEKEYANLPDDFKIKINPNIIDFIFTSNSIGEHKRIKSDEKGYITKKQAEKVYHIEIGDINEDSISFSLQGIRYFRNLKDIRFDNCDLYNMDELSYINTIRETWFTSCNLNLEETTGELRRLLTTGILETIQIENCGLTNVEFLSGFSDLHDVSLYLDQNEITDLTPLSNLERIAELVLNENQITDITPLPNLKTVGEGYHEGYHSQLLWGLSLDGNQITDISPLSNLKNIYIFYLEDNQITDITPLSKIKELKRLSLSNNQITDIKPLSKIKELERLSLSNNKITDIAALPDLKNISVLSLSGNLITDISPLASLKNQKDPYPDLILYLDDNKISDLTPLSKLKVQVITLSDNPITDISPLKTLKIMEVEHCEAYIELANLDIDYDLAKEMFGDFLVTEKPSEID